MGITWPLPQRQHLCEHFSMERCNIQLEFNLKDQTKEIFVRQTDLDDTLLDESVMDNELVDADETMAPQNPSPPDEEIDPAFYVEFLMYNGNVDDFQRKNISMNFEGCEYNWYTSISNQKVILYIS